LGEDRYVVSPANIRNIVLGYRKHTS
jgi:hypothetical protein